MSPGKLLGLGVPGADQNLCAIPTPTLHTLPRRHVGSSKGSRGPLRLSRYYECGWDKYRPGQCVLLPS